ncbi:LexA family protein [Polyangium fumosum]|uniref:LexA repressor DNA-binding domain-containing protein n=1 Tax=Polyangium fumosum TaxID=889272 RepID=A0A4U1I8P4_9BACT|nr:hypothetical protein [Polyangium fumosum]TKC89841.1 hypothetical protein E8A74_51300 [Polyangium fumosum]
MNVTPKQRAYLDYIRTYVALHREPPSEAEMAAFFHVSSPVAHRMVIALEQRGLIAREPGKARSIRIIVEPAMGPPREPPEERPTRPSGHVTDPLDPEIVGLVESLREDRRLVTLGSCWGHGKRPAYVDLAVDGLDGLRVFVRRINKLDRALADEAYIEVGLNWSEEVATACDFNLFPDWIMLSISIQGTGRNGAPPATLLAKIASRYRAACREATA